MIYYRYPTYRYPPIANQNMKYPNAVPNNTVPNMKSQNSKFLSYNQNFQKQTSTPTRQQFQKGTRTQFQDEINTKINPRTYSEIDSKRIQEKRHIPNKTDENTLFEILGIKLHFDDILLICLIFFLYNEGVQDQYLFIVLILLLLS